MRDIVLVGYNDETHIDLFIVSSSQNNTARKHILLKEHVIVQSPFFYHLTETKSETT